MAAAAQTLQLAMPVTYYSQRTGAEGRRRAVVVAGVGGEAAGHGAVAEAAAWGEAAGACGQVQARAQALAAAETRVGWRTGKALPLASRAQASDTAGLLQSEAWGAIISAAATGAATQTVTALPLGAALRTLKTTTVALVVPVPVAAAARATLLPVAPSEAEGEGAPAAAAVAGALLLQQPPRNPEQSLAVVAAEAAAAVAGRVGGVEAPTACWHLGSQAAASLPPPQQLQRWPQGPRPPSSAATPSSHGGHARMRRSSSPARPALGEGAEQPLPEGAVGWRAPQRWGAGQRRVATTTPIWRTLSPTMTTRREGLSFGCTSKHPRVRAACAAAHPRVRAAWAVAQASVRAARAADDEA